MKDLIGATGFIGTNLQEQTDFDRQYCSRNITEIEGRAFDELVIAAPGGSKLKANQNPEADLCSVNQLISSLSKTTAKTVVYVSTVDVYKISQGVNENTAIDTEDLHPYGLHRYRLEKFIQNHFINSLIVRLPNVFGNNLRKNFIYDLLTNTNLQFTHKDSCFQFYDLSNLWNDIKIALNLNIRLINFATEPMSAEEISQVIFSRPFSNITEKQPRNYDIRSLYAKRYNGHELYLYPKEMVKTELFRFVNKWHENI